VDDNTRIPEKPTLLLERYRIDGLLGEGGLGTVYKAYDTRLKRFVAIKTLKRSVYSNDPDMYRNMEERFHREAESGSRMHVHPNLVVVHDFVTDTDKSLYLVQEFVPGGTLADRLTREGALPQTDALRLAADTARGLSAAHEMHIVHRDIKPANIFLSADGRARVGDFGIAQLDDLSGRTRATSGHPGTPLYMSPEQAGSSGYVRQESDQYSLGLVLFEMLTGQTYKKLRKRQAEDLLTQQPEQIQTLVRKMIADDPDDRYESMMDVATEIQRIERQVASAATSLPQSVSNDTVIVQDLPTVPAKPDVAVRAKAPTPKIVEAAMRSVDEMERGRDEDSLTVTDKTITPETSVAEQAPRTKTLSSPTPARPISRRNILVGTAAIAVVTVTGGVVAFSNRQPIDRLAGSTSTPTPTHVPVNTPQYRINGNGAKLFDQPDFRNGNVSMALPAKGTVYVIENDSTFLKVVYYYGDKSVEGWVLKEDVTPIS
jgi:serine/threonine protein kinase